MSRLELTRRNQRLTATSTTGEDKCQKGPDTPRNQKLSDSKEIKWKMLPGGLYTLFYIGGGELPPELCGTWTSVNKVQKAIDSYFKKRYETRGF